MTTLVAHAFAGSPNNASHTLSDGAPALSAGAPALSDGAPELEIVRVPERRSVKIWAHGYPYRTVRWHFHPEYEVHLVTNTSGIRYVGDSIDQFRPGDLVMVAPNLPHNWISDVPPQTVVAERCLVLQFTEASIQRCVEAFPEMKIVDSLLSQSLDGVLFTPQTARRVEPVMRAMMEASGPAQVSLFLRVLDELVNDPLRARLVGRSFSANPHAYLSAPVNRAITFISEHLTEDINEADLARHCGQSVSSFSKAFHKQTGATFVHYVNAKRIELACQHLTQDEISVTEICYQVGFNNVSNFNRQFAAAKGMTPSQLRKLYRRRAASG